jgi:hypothetical protein
MSDFAMVMLCFGLVIAALGLVAIVDAMSRSDKDQEGIGHGSKGQG